MALLRKSTKHYRRTSTNLSQTLPKNWRVHVLVFCVFGCYNKIHEAEYFKKKELICLTDSYVQEHGVGILARANHVQNRLKGKTVGHMRGRGTGLPFL
jgi:hypothetical protein